jgi:hypothetical protein
MRYTGHLPPEDWLRLRAHEEPCVECGVPHGLLELHTIIAGPVDLQTLYQLRHLLGLRCDRCHEAFLSLQALGDDG